MLKKGFKGWGWTRRLALGALFAAGLGAAQAAACQPATYCQTSGACLPTSQVERQVMAKYGSQGYAVRGVRLVADTSGSACVIYKVTLTHGQKGGKVVYWNVRGGEAR